MKCGEIMIAYISFLSKEKANPLCKEQFDTKGALKNGSSVPYCVKESKAVQNPVLTLYLTDHQSSGSGAHTGHT